MIAQERETLRIQERRGVAGVAYVVLFYLENLGSGNFSRFGNLLNSALDLL